MTCQTSMLRRRRLAETGIQGTVSLTHGGGQEVQGNVVEGALRSHVEQRNSYDEESAELLGVERTERLLC